MKGKRGPRPPFNKTPRRKGSTPTPIGLEGEVPRKLSDDEINERSRRLARKQVELCALERQKRNATKAVNADIKECRAHVDQLAEEIVHGEEMVKQGDLFAPKKGDAKLPPAKAKATLVEVAKRAEPETTTGP